MDKERIAPETSLMYGDKKVPESSLRDIYYVLFRHKKKVVIFFIAVVFTVAFSTFLAPEFYKSDAKLLVKLGRESVTLDPTATTGQTISISQPREYEINSELEILKSREIAENVVDAIGTDVILKRPDEVLLGDTTATGRTRDAVRDARQRIRSVAGEPMSMFERLDLLDPLKEHDSAVLSVMGSLNINVEKSSNIISLSYEARSPQLAYEVLSKLIDFYLEKHIAVHRTSGSHEFFIQQTDQLREKLAQSEEALREIKNNTGISSLDEQRTIILERVGTLQQDIEVTSADLATSNSKVEELQRLLANLPEKIETGRTSGLDNMGYGYMRNALYALQLKEQDLLSKYTEENQLVKEVRRQIAEAQSLLNKEEPTHTQVMQSLNVAYQQVHSDLLAERATLSSLEGKSKALKGLLTDAQGELVALNNSEAQIVRLQREIAIQEVTYRNYVDNLEQARIDNALQMEKISNIGVVQPASFPMKTSRPNKMLNLMLGLFFGVFGGVGLAFFSEYIDHSLKTQEDIDEKLQLRTLIVIPRRPKKIGKIEVKKEKVLQ